MGIENKELDLPDSDDDDQGRLLGVIVAIVNAPLDGPETVDRYGGQHPRRGEHAVVVEDDPDGAEHLAERPVVEEDVDGEEEHRERGHDEVGDGQVADEDRERRAQLLLELVRDGRFNVRHETTTTKYPTSNGRSYILSN